MEKHKKNHKEIIEFIDDLKKIYKKQRNVEKWAAAQSIKLAIISIYKGHYEKHT